MDKSGLLFTKIPKDLIDFSNFYLPRHPPIWSPCLRTYTQTCWNDTIFRHGQTYKITFKNVLFA